MRAFGELQGETGRCREYPAARYEADASADNAKWRMLACFAKRGDEAYAQ